MKTANDVMKYLEKELTMLSREDIEIYSSDSRREVDYKRTQQGKLIAYKKLMCYIKGNKSLNKDIYECVNECMAKK